MNELSSVIGNMNTCYLMPYERHYYSSVLKQHNAIAYKYEHGNITRYRIIIPSIAGIVIHRENNKRYTIQGIYVIPEKRKQGVAKQLIALCHLAFNAIIAHSEHLTIDGQLAFNR